MECGTERISRMEKCYYPRNDTVNAVVSNLLPRDGREDILPDQNGDPVYLERSSILDGVEIRGFGYTNNKPYKWHLEIESALLSVAVVPDRFFSIYGKAYPIKRRQTVGINQPSEAFKYEIIYLRGYDKYNDENPEAKIIYHKQQENFEETRACATTDDDTALRYLDDANKYPYLKLRVCYDGSVRAYLGTKNVDWDLTRQIDDDHADVDTAWVEVPQINTDQFRGIDLWLRFESMNALSYYLITKYENNIFNIGPKDIKPGLPQHESAVEQIEKEVTEIIEGETVTYNAPFYHVPAGVYQIINLSDSEQMGFERAGMGPGATTHYELVNFSTVKENIKDSTGGLQKHVLFSIDDDYDVRINTGVTKNEAIWLALLAQNNLVSGLEKTSFEYVQNPDYYWPADYGDNPPEGFQKAYGDYKAKVGEPVGKLYIPLVDATVVDPSDPTTVTTTVLRYGSWIQVNDKIIEKKVSQVVGLDYELENPAWTEDTTGCIPCCKKDNLSRAIWAYVNPKTMQPYDDDYWFHQGEPYYKASLTLSTVQNPLKAQKIFVEQGTFPGMYKIVAETYIRARDTGEDQRVQITLPLCKIKSDQTLTLQADGDPTTFNLDVEVATPQNGVPMEITFYEVEKELKQGCSGNMVPKDGSTKISAK